MVLNSSRMPLSMSARGGSKYPPRQPGTVNPKTRRAGEGPRDAFDGLKLELMGKGGGMKSTRFGGGGDDKKKVRMAAIQERNEKKAVRRKQQNIVLQKFLTKFGQSTDRATKSALANSITKMVTIYFDARSLGEDLTAAMLADLERRVEGACQKIPKEVEAYKRDFERSGAKGKYGSSSKPTNVPDLDLQAGGGSDLTLPSNINNDWAALTIANAIDFEEKKRKEKVDDKERKMKQRQKFDQQKAENDRRRQQEIEEGRLERLRNQEKFNDFKRQEAEQAEKKAKEHEELRRMYAQQVEQRRIEKEKEARRLKEEAEKDAARLARELKSSQDAALDLKRSERKRYQAMVDESARNEIVRQQEKEKQAAADRKLAADYKKKLDKEEAARAKALEDRMKRYEGIGEEWAKTGAGAQKAKEEAKILAIIAKEAAKKEQRDDDRNRLDKEKIAHDKVMMKKLNARLLQEKKARDEHEKSMEAKFYNSMKQENEHAISMEKMKEENRKQAAYEYKSKLKQQQLDNLFRSNAAETNLAVSETERLMNSKLFEKLKTDKELIHKMQRKFEPVRPGLASQRARESVRGGGGVADLVRMSGEERAKKVSPLKRRKNRTRR
ncbi:hypothetical protein TrVE_jg4535 [Triparma verrucosa]|uniref:Uncharacterized protein n=1 Tax=Triparma verrucosa TaxID=1606542 RepID=A0A9W7FHP7_9STRA|nr:hypothetical protein TrVE_jg4535 [Triparma verrucosa]